MESERKASEKGDEIGRMFGVGSEIRTTIMKIFG